MLPLQLVQLSASTIERTVVRPSLSSKRFGSRHNRSWQPQTITLNPVSVLVNGGVLQTVSPDSRATTVQPQCTAVIAVPDLTVVQLQAENPGVALQHNTDPTGVIHCPDGALAKYCHSYTASNNRAAYVSASQVLNFGATGWEFENIILARLGYNTAGR
jgi:hypothetical protein